MSMIKTTPIPLTRPQFLRRLKTTLSVGLSGPTFANAPTHAPVVDYLTTGRAKPTDELVLLGAHANSNNVWVYHSIVIRNERNEETGEDEPYILADLNEEFSPSFVDGVYRFWNGSRYTWLKELVRYPLGELAGEDMEIPVVLTQEGDGIL